MSSHTTLGFDVIAEAHRNWLRRGWEAADAMAAATSIMRAQQLVLARVDATLKPFDLTFARYEVLTLLHLSRRGALPIGKLGVRLMVHPTSVTHAVNRLEDQGLVRRGNDVRDRRTVLAKITAEGHRVADAATVALGAARFGMDGLDDGGCGRLTTIVRRLRKQAGDFR
jgi:DNA-binding MarR family transcriptional regulator